MAKPNKIVKVPKAPTQRREPNVNSEDILQKIQEKVVGLIPYLRSATFNADEALLRNVIVGKAEAYDEVRTIIAELMDATKSIEFLDEEDL